MEFTFAQIDYKKVDIDFDKIVEILKKENNGVFVDDFMDNIEYYLNKYMGVDDETYEDFEDVNNFNSTQYDLVFEEWQNYLEKKGLL